MQQEEPKLDAEVRSWMERAQAIDATEDAEHGSDRRGDETPAWPDAKLQSGMADKQRRLQRLRAAKAQLEAEAKAGPGACDPDGPGPSSGMQERGDRKKARAAAADPAPDPMPPHKAQRNCTDPDSRIMLSGGGVIAGYNGQIAVDAEHQIITAQRVSSNPADFDALEPLVDDTIDAIGKAPAEVSADTGFASEANLHAMDARGVGPYLCPGRLRHGSTDPKPSACSSAPLACRRWPTRSAGPGDAADTGCASKSSSRCSAMIKHARGFRQFLLRGLDKVRGEWAMVCTAHNQTKLHAATG